MRKLSIKFKEKDMTKKEYISLILSAIICTIIGMCFVLKGYTSWDPGSDKNMASSTKSISTTQLPLQIINSDTNTSKYTVTLVYRQDCPYCDSARKTILENLSKYSEKDIQFNQINVDTELGQKLKTSTNIKTVPLIFISNVDSKNIYVLNDSNKPKVVSFLKTHIFNNF